MNNKNSIKRLVFVITTVGVFFCTVGNVALAKNQSLPDGFSDYLVYMATGTIPFTPHPNAQISGCGTSLFCDGDYFQTVIMGRSQAEVDVERQRAKDYFLTRFGVDVDTLEADQRIVFSSFFLDPRGEYRAYTAANEKAPSEGWVVRDGGFVLTVLDPNGIELGGEFEGLGLPPIPAGGLLLYGDYNILISKQGKKKSRTKVISYRSDMPMVANLWGELVVNCQISPDSFATNQHAGKAQGMGLVIPGATGLTLSWRNVLTLGGLQ